MFHSFKTTPRPLDDNGDGAKAVFEIPCDEGIATVKRTSATILPVMVVLTLLAGFSHALDKPTEGSTKAKKRPVSVAQAQRLLRQQDWAAAADAYEQVVRDNADDGANWFNYGFALHSLKRCDEAIKAADKAVELGYRPATAMYNIACAHALMGHKDEALAWLEKSLTTGFVQDELMRTDTDLASIRDDTRFKKLVGSPPEGLSREERWRYDLDHLVRRMEKVHYKLYAKVSREKLRQAIDDLKSKIDKIKELEGPKSTKPPQPLPGKDQSSASSKAPRKLQARVDAYLAPYVANRDFSGFVLIARGDDVLVNKGYGMANFKLGVPNTADTKFRIASLTKTFTAAAIVMLKERGLLSFDDKLGKFLPDFPKGDKITLLQMLLHKSGIPNPDDTATFHQQIPLDAVVMSIGKKPLDFDPGTTDKYSNGGYLVLARVVEKVSGQSYESFLRKNIFEPLRMKDTGNFQEEPIVPHRASGYLPGPGIEKIENAPVHNLSTSIGSGSLYSTANDLLRWARAVRSEKLYKRTALPYPFGWGSASIWVMTASSKVASPPDFARSCWSISMIG